MPETPRKVSNMRLAHARAVWNRYSKEQHFDADIAAEGLRRVLECTRAEIARECKKNKRKNRKLPLFEGKP